MAGSWDHITDRHGRFAGLGTVENMGDAYEALEQCYGMVLYLADWLSKGFASDREQAIRQAVANYKRGLEIGGRGEADE